MTALLLVLAGVALSFTARQMAATWTRWRRPRRDLRVTAFHRPWHRAFPIIRASKIDHLGVQTTRLLVRLPFSTLVRVFVRPTRSCEHVLVSGTTEAPCGLSNGHDGDHSNLFAGNWSSDEQLADAHI